MLAMRNGASAVTGMWPFRSGVPSAPTQVAPSAVATPRTAAGASPRDRQRCRIDCHWLGLEPTGSEAGTIEQPPVTSSAAASAAAAILANEAFRATVLINIAS